ncbi:MAG: HD domain-containing protein [Frankiales bacterium]|nr:HD domain-containing protein [Frankiales bacterium]
MLLSDVPHPRTLATATALEACIAYGSPALVNHCRRSYVWAAAYAEGHGIAYDAELLYVAAMLHDIGLVREFDNVSVPFEEAGGHAAWVFAAGAGWPIDRRRRVAEVVVRHMWDSVDVEADPEGFLLEIATGLDISGRNPGWWDAALRRDVVAALPRLTLAEEFTACIRDQAERKPESSAAAAVARGLPDRLAANVLDSPDPGV